MNSKKIFSAAASCLLILMLGISQSVSAYPYATPVTYDLTGTKGAVSADFNVDGFPDIAAIFNGNPSRVYIYFNDTNGSFSVSGIYTVGAVGADLSSIAVGNFNAGGVPDLVVAQEANDVVSVLINNGDGTFASSVNYAVGNAPRMVVIGNFDGAGNDDIAVVNSSDANFSILINDGTGVFAAAVNYSLGTNPVSIGAGDFDGDEDLDIVGLNRGDPGFDVYSNDGSGVFTVEVSYSTSANPLSMHVADLNADGLPDISIGYLSGSVLDVYNGVGTYNFDDPVSHATGGANQVALDTADLNNDNHVDIVTLNPSLKRLAILLGHSDGTFDTPVFYSTAGFSPTWLSVGNLDDFAGKDLMVAASTSDKHMTFLSVNPVPTIDSVDPAEADLGDTGITVDIYGSGFVPGSVASLDGDPRTTTFIDTTHLTIDLLTSDFEIGGEHEIDVTNTSPGGGTNSIEFDVLYPSPTISSISPEEGVIDTTFNVVVTGTGFNGDVSYVDFGADISVGNTSIDSDTQMTAEITIDALASPGYRDVTVYSDGPGGGQDTLTEGFLVTLVAPSPPPPPPTPPPTPSPSPTPSGGGSGGGYAITHAPQGGFAVSIQNGAPSTGTQAVTLTLAGGPDAKTMLISNDPAFTGAVAEPYALTKQWLLTGTEGVNTVYVQYNPTWKYPSPVVSDSIVFSATASPALATLFTKDLKLGMTDPDVLLLQRTLNKLGFTLTGTGPGSPGNETAFFGTLTFQAVKKFQEAYRAQVLAPLGLASPTGFFGPQTRAFMNTLIK